MADTEKTVAPGAGGEAAAAADVDKTLAAVTTGSSGANAPGGRDNPDRVLAEELARRGVPPEEIARLLSLGKPAGDAAQAEPAAVPAVEVPRYEPHPTVVLPEPREATPEEKDKAEKLLLQANIARRRGRYHDAEALTLEALALTPSDAPALEMLGDTYQELGRVDDALHCYDRAREVAPHRKSAELKFAELRLMQNREVAMLRGNAEPRSPYVAAALSLVLPGAGQVYNGQALKGVLVALVFVALVGTLGWTPFGLAQGLSMQVVTLLAVTGAVYVFGLIDAHANASRGGSPRSGWEV